MKDGGKGRQGDGGGAIRRGAVPMTEHADKGPACPSVRLSGAVDPSSKGGLTSQHLEVVQHRFPGDGSEGGRDRARGLGQNPDAVWANMPAGDEAGSVEKMCAARPAATVGAMEVATA